jgi:hypothetical protein
MTYAITANPQVAKEFGILEDHIFPFWDWVGGRFSVWSAVGLPIALKFGFDTFQDFLAGAQAMDQHFLQSPDHFGSDCPVAGRHIEANLATGQTHVHPLQLLCKAYGIPESL